MTAIAIICTFIFVITWFIGYGARPTQYQLRYGQVRPLFWVMAVANALAFLGAIGFGGAAIWGAF